MSEDARKRTADPWAPPGSGNAPDPRRASGPARQNWPEAEASQDVTQFGTEVAAAGGPGDTVLSADGAGVEGDGVGVAGPPSPAAAVPYAGGVSPGAPGEPVPPPPISPDGPGQVPYGYPGYGGSGYPGYGYPGSAGYPGPPGVFGPSPGPYWPPHPVAPNNGTGTTAMVIGIVAAVGFCLWPLAIVLGVVAIVLGVIGSRRVRRGEATNEGQALTGIVCGVIGVLLGVAMLAVYVAGDDSDSDRDRERSGDDGYSTSLVVDTSG